MSDFFILPPRRAFVRSTGVLGHYPCFQTTSEGAFLIDRSGSGNGAALGSDSVLATAFGTTSRYTQQADATGTKNYAAQMPAAVTTAWNPSTETLVIAGIWNGANDINRWVAGFGGSSAASVHGLLFRTDASTGAVKFQSTGIGGTARNINTGALALAAGADKAFCFLIDGPAKRMWLYVDGAPDTTMNQASNVGCDWSAYADFTTSSFGPMTFGGVPHSGGKALTYAATMYGLQVAKRTGSKPANFEEVARRLARHPLQVLSATEWPV